jgi:Recombinase
LRQAHIREIAVEGRRIAVARRVAQADRRAADVAPVVRELQAAGLSLRGIAADLTARGIPTPQGGAWSAVQVSRVLARAA